MRVLVTGGTGTVGSRVARRLVQRGVDTRVLTSRPDRRGGVVEGATAVVGDLMDRGSLDRALEGVERLFLLTPVHPDEAHMGRNAAAAAAAAGVERVVFVSVHDVEDGAHLPHFKSKIEIADALGTEGLTHVVLRPNNFFQNDLPTTQVIAEGGLYPHPLGGRGVQRVDVRDIADAGVTALMDDTVEGPVPVNGPDVLTQDDCARQWADALGRAVKAIEGPDAWRGMMEPHLPTWMLDDLTEMFRFFGEHGFTASEAESARQREVLGREPRRYADFVEEEAEELV